MFLFQSPLHFSTEPESDLSDLLGFFVMLRDFRNYLGGERRGGVVFGWIRWFGGVFCVTLW